MGRNFALWQYIRDYLRTSLWGIPALLMLVAFALAELLLPVRVLGDTGPHSSVWWLHTGNARDAADLLNALLSAMITMMTMVVSIMMVVLTLAANQLGPRLIRNFVGDHRTQGALGFLLAVITYILLVLRALDGDAPRHEVPHLAVTAGSVLALASIVVLLFFVHHLARSIVTDNVIHRVGRDLDAAIGRLDPRDADEDVPADEGGGAVLGLHHGGYVQIINFEGLVRCATRAGATLRLAFRGGDHLLPGGAHILVQPPQALSRDLAQEIEDSILMGDERTPPQDLEFGLRQLVEIALRALSPSINDPFTAIAAIDRLTAVLALIMEHRLGPALYRDGAGMVRVIARPPGFAGVVEASFSQIRQNAAGRTDVLARLLEALHKLAVLARESGHRAVLGHHADMVLALGRRSVAEPHDLAALEQRHRAVRAAL